MNSIETRRSSRRVRAFHAAWLAALVAWAGWLARERWLAATPLVLEARALERGAGELPRNVFAIGPPFTLATGSALAPAPGTPGASVEVAIAAGAGEGVVLVDESGPREIAVENGVARATGLTAADWSSAVVYVGPLAGAPGGALLGFREAGPVATGLARLRDSLASLGLDAGPRGDAGLLVIEQGDESDPLPRIEAGRARVLPLAPSSPLSWEALATAIALDRSSDRFPSIDGARAWWLAAIARRLAIRAVHGDAEDRRLLDVFDRYVFQAPSREKDLATWPTAEGNSKSFLGDVKGPTLLFLIERAAGSGARPKRWLEVLARIARGDEPRLAVAAELGEAAASVLDAAGGGSGSIGEPSGPLAAPALAERPPSPIESSARLTLALTADVENFLETCGCRLKQDGGIARRAWRLAAARRDGPPLVALDLGGLLPRLAPKDVDSLARGEMAIQFRALAAMGYDGVAVGSNELYHGAALLDAASRDARATLALQSCNARVDSGDAPWTRGAAVVERGGLRVRLVGVTAASPRWIRPDEFDRRTAGRARVDDPLEAARAAVAGAPESDLVLVYGEIAPRRVAELVAAAPGIDVVVTSDDRPAPSTRARTRGESRRLASGFLGSTLVVYANEESRGLSLVDLACAADGRVASFAQESFALSPDVPEDAGVRALLDAFYASFEDAEGAKSGPGRKRPFASESAERALAAGGGEDGGYAGAESCRACHPAAYARWAATPHAGAYRTLALKHRENSPACLPCHVVGYGLPTGYTLRDKKNSRALEGVQCEVCHGPGRSHALGRPSEASGMRRSIGLSSCAACHDAEHSEPLEPRSDAALRIGAHRDRGEIREVER